jgi:hypothetical protein
MPSGDFFKGRLGKVPPLSYLNLIMRVQRLSVIYSFEGSRLKQMVQEKKPTYSNVIFAMSFKACTPAFLLLTSMMLLLSCAKKPASDPCCTFADLPMGAEVKDGQGAIQVEGSTSAYFYILDETGKQVGYQSLNQTLAVAPGRYSIKVNNSLYPVTIEAGILAKCSTGTLMVSGNTSEYYYVMDSTNNQLGYENLGKSMSFFPGTFKVKVNNTETPAVVKLKQLTEMRTGTLIVRGNTNEYYYVLDDTNKQLNYNSLEKPLAFLPGTYLLKVNHTSMKADVIAGKATELRTGSILVKGLTDEYYYVTDTIGNALNYQTLNKSLAVFPGTFHIKVNNTLMVGKVSEGQTAEFITGSLMLSGGGTQYYYVLDQIGNQLNYNSLNKSLSFFPSEYVIKLGSSTRKATVTAGELTSVNAFN